MLTSDKKPRKKPSPGLIPPELLLHAYRMGVFPMAEGAESNHIDWVEPIVRGVIPIENFHLPKNINRLVKKGGYTVKYNTAFESVIRACANRAETWINELIVRSYVRLHALGFAHSTEIFRDDILVGGQYGVAIGGAFMGESMFHTEPDADKLALYHTHERLREKGFILWDTQFWTPHLARFGCMELPQAEYLALLAEAVRLDRKFNE